MRRMTEVDYSLERWPSDADEWFDIEPVDGEFHVDLEAEDAAHRINQAISNWIERKALTSFGIDHRLLPNHTYVGIEQTEFVDDVCSQKYEVGFFPDLTNWTLPPKPTLTLYVWRTQQLGFGVVWSSFGFRCEPIDDLQQEQVYHRVLAAVLKDTETRM